MLCLIPTLAANGCASDLRLVQQDALVKIYAQDSRLPHGYGDQILEFKGKRYKHLAGTGYVLVSEKKIILFVTSANGEQKTLHAVPIDNGEAIQMDLGDTSFGAGFGLPKEDPASHYVETVEGDKITFVAKYGLKPDGVRFVIDLKARSFDLLPKTERKDNKTVPPNPVR